MSNEQRRAVLDRVENGPAVRGPSLFDPSRLSIERRGLAVTKKLTKWVGSEPRTRCVSNARRSLAKSEAVPVRKVSARGRAHLECPGVVSGFSSPARRLLSKSCFVGGRRVVFGPGMAEPKSRCSECEPVALVGLVPWCGLCLPPRTTRVFRWRVASRCSSRGRG